MKSDSNRSQIGATMLEFTLVATIFFASCFAIMEITRYLSIDVVTSSANQVAMNYARKVAYLDEDIRLCTPPYTSCIAYQRLLDARQRVQKVVRKIVNGTIGYGLPSDGTRSDTNLRRYRNIDFLGATWTPVTISADSTNELDVLILRPGDAAIDNLTGETLCHPTVRPQGFNSCVNPTGTEYQNAYQWKYIIRNQSIIVGVSSDYKSLIPLESIVWLALNMIVSNVSPVILN